MVSTTVHLLRHGEVHNPEGVLYGRLPGYRLSERGQEMAARVAKHLSGRDVTVVIASPLQRAQETATPIAQAFGVELGTDDRLLEAENHFEGKRFGVGDGALRQPAHWKHLWNPFRPSWGEPYTDQVRRMRAAVESARQAAEGHEAVLVSHQLPVWLIRCSLEGRRLWHNPRHRQCNLASLTSLRFEDDRFTALHYTEPVADLYDGVKQLPGA
ncbi:histidine phosphatase family protein [Myceligenerans pegani]|uniref:Histidine phosphatase family protein n=1 Tax=Myceligenerans pegani TaxID=2776917 RepID=A0ABR9N4M5_9MICO|nr:histidine phosphatase family protein [Myceligenerans sp. TRM 65318]MBE1878625.1 histidine phosphatase family protein [Myceligenerans sp. TRM 65318]MBE3020896.1 histidine phosphatase family protein [Myceligenerans sp. TRM 65318]